MPPATASPDRRGRRANRRAIVVTARGAAALPAPLADAARADVLDGAAHPSVGADVFVLPLEAGGLTPNFLDAGGVHPLPPPPRAILSPTGNSPAPPLVTRVEGLFGEGYDAVCVVRDAAPHLPTAFYTEAFGRLEQGAEAAIVPDEGGGGHVLIGLRADAATPGARASLLTAGTADGLRAAFLPRWYLIDAPSGLTRLRTDLRRGTAHAPRTRRILETLEPKTT